MSNLLCSALSSVALNVSWPCVASTDLYYVAIFGDSTAAAALKPLAIATATGCSTVLDDLVGGTEYYLRVRSHPSSAPATVWGWRPYQDDAVRCATPNAPALVLERDGALDASSIGLRWTSALPSSSNTTFAVRWRAEPTRTAGSYVLSAGRWSGSRLLNASSSSSRTATITGLAAGTSYVMIVEGSSSVDGGGRQTVVSTSDPVRFSTAAPGITYSTMYRVAEDTAEIDLLENHNAGTLVGEAAFLTDSGNFVVPPAQLAVDPCARALNQTSCRPKTKRGGGFGWPAEDAASCMSCITAVWEHGVGAAADVVRAQCSNPGLPFPGDNKVAEAFCGVGFSFFDWINTPITEYCVRHEEVPKPRTTRTRTFPHAEPGWGVAGFAPYVSCNAPEAGALNSHSNPVCICACYADRLIAMQPKAELERHCGAQKDTAHPTYHDCNCTVNGGVREPNASASHTFVGAMAVQCPYFLYTQPVADYGYGVPCGLWLSLPKAGACHHDEGDGVMRPKAGAAKPCTWQRSAMARNLYGTALLAAGWNRSSSFIDKTGARWNDTELTLANSRALAKAFTGLDNIVKPRCCGC